jgi:tRNA nucleotidyltransferase/poly(A) polymerase
LHDLEHKILRTIENPHVMFERDPILVFRAIKIMRRLQLVPEPGTEQALHSCAHLTLQIMAYVADNKNITHLERM